MALGVKKKPKPKVKLIGKDGNSFLILGECARVLKSAGYSLDEIERFRADAMGGDYDHLLAVIQKWLKVY